MGPQSERREREGVLCLSLNKLGRVQLEQSEIESDELHEFLHLEEVKPGTKMIL